MRRIAILPGNILIPDESLGWLRTGLPLLLQTDLASAAHASAIVAESESQAYQGQMPETLRATVEHRHSQFRISVVITDLSTQTAIDTFVVARPDSRGVIEAGDAVAKHLDLRSSPFSSRVPDAFRSYVQAVASSASDARMASLSKAITLDPGFGLAYFSAIDVTGRGDPEAAQDLLKQAVAHKTGFTALDQARLAAISARLSHESLSEQAAASEALVGVTPNSIDALVSLASLRFLQGNAASGKILFEKSLSLSPGNATIASYLALGLVEGRQFKDAERIYESLQSDPAILPQLAVCTFLEGDTPGANRLFEKFLHLRTSSGDIAAPLIQANWLAITGRVPEAVALLKSSQFPSPDLRSLALSQSAIWELMENHVTDNGQDAGASLRVPTSAAVRSLALAAHAICCGAKSPQMLRLDVNGLPLRDDQKAVVLAYGMFLNGHFAEAADAWTDIVRRSGETDLRSRAMLAASLDRAGKGSASSTLPIEPFVPNLTADDQFGAVAFSEMRRLLSR